MKIQSQYQPFLTIDYIVKEDENKLFDRKSSKVKPTDIAPIISAFANAEGGTVVIGVAEKTRETHLKRSNGYITRRLARLIEIRT